MRIDFTNIRRMEPLIMERLRLAFPEKDFSIERVPQVLTIKEFERLAKLSPFIGLAWTGFKTDSASGRALVGRMQWRLILIFKASSGLQTRFKGDARGIGLDAMVDVSVALMHGWTLPNVGSSEVTLVNSVIADGWAEDNIAIAQVDFSILCTAPISKLELLTLDDFRSIGATWVVSDDEDADTITDETDIPQETP